MVNLCNDKIKIHCIDQILTMEELRMGLDLTVSHEADLLCFS